MSISNLFGIIVSIFECSDCLIVVQRSCFSILGSYFLHPKTITTVYSPDFPYGETSKFFFSSKHHDKFCSSDLHFTKIRENLFFLYFTDLFWMWMWFSGFWSKETTERRLEFFKRKMISSLNLLSKLWRSERFVYAHDSTNGISTHTKLECYIDFLHSILNIVLYYLDTSKDSIPFFTKRFVTHSTFGYHR